MKIFPIILSLTGLLCLSSASAQLAHRYSFTTDGSDSVGTADGLISGNAVIAGGMLTTTGGNGDYLALPSNVAAGITGDFTIETFVTLPTNPNNFASLFSLSASGNRNFFLVNPSRPNAGGSLSANFQEKDGSNVNGAADSEVDVRPGSGASFPFGAQHDLAITYVSLSNVVTLYLDGTAIASGSIAGAVGGPSFNLATVSGGGTAAGQISSNGINGNGPFGDASINGSTNDFRIFSSALTADQVAAVDGAGADATNAAIGALVPEPSTWVAMVMSLVALCGLQRFRRSNG